jgi:hypothetical protein
MIFYVQMKKDIIHPVVIKGDEKEIISEYKYFGMYLTKKSTWSNHVDAVIKTTHSRSKILQCS